MEIKGLVAGIFLAFGASNLLSSVGIPFSVRLGLNVGGFELGSLVLGLVSIVVAAYLVRSK
jgi:hypothetical protein